MANSTLEVEFWNGHPGLATKIHGPSIQVLKGFSARRFRQFASRQPTAVSSGSWNWGGVEIKFPALGTLCRTRCVTPRRVVDSEDFLDGVEDREAAEQPRYPHYYVITRLTLHVANRAFGRRDQSEVVFALEDPFARFREALNRIAGDRKRTGPPVIQAITLLREFDAYRARLAIVDCEYPGNEQLLKPLWALHDELRIRAERLLQVVAA